MSLSSAHSRPGDKKDDLNTTMSSMVSVETETSETSAVLKSKRTSRGKLKVGHTRSRTFDLSLPSLSQLPFQKSSGQSRSRQDLLDSEDIEREFLVTSKQVGVAEPGPIRVIRRVHSDTRVQGQGPVTLQVSEDTRRGLAHLESQEYSEVLLTSEEDECSSNSEINSLGDGEDQLGCASPGEGGSPSSRARRKKTNKKPNKRKKKSKRRKEKDTVQVPYYKDSKGELRDEYGFRVQDEEPHYLCSPALTSENHKAVPHDAKKKIISRDVVRRRQRRVWSDLMSSLGEDIGNLPPSALERWRKYCEGSRSADSAESYLLRISSPNFDALNKSMDSGSAVSPISPNETTEFDVFGESSKDQSSPNASREKRPSIDSSLDGIAGEMTALHLDNDLLAESAAVGSSNAKERHRKQLSNASQSSSVQSPESPRRGSRTFMSLGSMVRKIRSHKRKPNTTSTSSVPNSPTITGQDCENDQNIFEDAESNASRSTGAGDQFESARSPGKDQSSAEGFRPRRASEVHSANLSPSQVVQKSPQGMGGSSGASFARQFTQTIRFVGVPPKLRREVWLYCSGAFRKMISAGPTDQFEFLVRVATRKDNPPEMAEIIERDLHRTFPTNYHFEEEEGITRMRRVLLAYSLRNPSIGYCQSMNFLVAVLLLHMEENLAFWALAAIVEDLVPGHYTKQMTGMHVDQRVFESLVKQRLPKIHAHLESLCFPLEFVTYQWFLCLFVNSLPLETTLRIWDCFLHEGSKALFRSGLAILMILQKDILGASSFQEVYDCLSLGESFERKSMLTGDKVIKLAYDPISFMSFSSAKISQLREQHLPTVLVHLGQQSEWEDFRQGRPITKRADAPGVTTLSKSNIGPEAVSARKSMSTPAELNSPLTALGSPTEASPNASETARMTPLQHPKLEKIRSQETPSNNDQGRKALSNVSGKSNSDSEFILVDRVSSAPGERLATNDDGEGNESMSESRRRQLKPYASEMFNKNRRPSMSFKYQIRHVNSPLDAMHHLGVRLGTGPDLYRKTSASIDEAPRESSRSFSSYMPRRASTNTPLFKEQNGRTMSELFRFKAALDRRIDHNDTVQNTPKTDAQDHLQEDIQDGMNSEILFEETAPIGTSLDAVNVEVSNSGLAHASSGVETDNEDDLEDDGEDDGSDIPSEFSGLLPSLAYVMSARQVEVEDGGRYVESPRRRQPGGVGNQSSAKMAAGANIYIQTNYGSSETIYRIDNTSDTDVEDEEDEVKSIYVASSFSGKDLGVDTGLEAVEDSSAGHGSPGPALEPAPSAVGLEVVSPESIDRKMRQKKSFFASIMNWGKKEK